MNTTPIYCRPIRYRRHGTRGNAITVHSAGLLRLSYRWVRQSGADADTARDAIWTGLFVGTLASSTFVPARREVAA